MAHPVKGRPIGWMRDNSALLRTGKATEQTKPVEEQPALPGNDIRRIVVHRNMVRKMCTQRMDEQTLSMLPKVQREG